MHDLSVWRLWPPLNDSAWLNIFHSHFCPSSHRIEEHQRQLKRCSGAWTLVPNWQWMTRRPFLSWNNQGLMASDSQPDHSSRLELIIFIKTCREIRMHISRTSGDTFDGRFWGILTTLCCFFLCAKYCHLCLPKCWSVAQVDSGRQWFLHAIYTVRSQVNHNRGVGKRGVHHSLLQPWDLHRRKRDATDINGFGGENGKGTNIIRISLTDQLIEEHITSETGNSGLKLDSLSGPITIGVVIFLLIAVVLLVVGVLLHRRRKEKKDSVAISALYVGRTVAMPNGKTIVLPRSKYLMGEHTGSVQSEVWVVSEHEVPSYSRCNPS